MQASQLKLFPNPPEPLPEVFVYRPDAISLDEESISRNSNPITSANPFGVLSPTSVINADTLNPTISNLGGGNWKRLESIRGALQAVKDVRTERHVPVIGNEAERSGPLGRIRQRSIRATDQRPAAGRRSSHSCAASGYRRAAHFRLDEARRLAQDRGPALSWRYFSRYWRYFDAPDLNVDIAASNRPGSIV
jgi:hypothetical protein